MGSRDQLIALRRNRRQRHSPAASVVGLMCLTFVGGYYVLAAISKLVFDPWWFRNVNMVRVKRLSHERSR